MRRNGLECDRRTSGDPEGSIRERMKARSGWQGRGGDERVITVCTAGHADDEQNVLRALGPRTVTGAPTHSLRRVDRLAPSGTSTRKRFENNAVSQLRSSWT